MASSVILQLAETLKQTAQQLAAQEIKSAVDLTESRREREGFKQDRTELRRQIEDLRKQRDLDINDFRNQRDISTKQSNEFQLEKETWKQDAKSSQASLDHLALNYQRLEDQYNQLKQDNLHLQQDRDHWKQQYLKTDQDVKKWQGHYVQLDHERETLSTKIADLVEEQLALRRSAVHSIPFTPHTPQSRVLKSISSPIVQMRPKASANAEETILPTPKHTSLHGQTRQRPTRPRSAAGRSEPPPPYRNDQSTSSSSSSSASHRSKRQRLSEYTPPFQPTSSILVRRVENITVPCAIKDEEDLDNDQLLASPSKKPVVRLHSHKHTQIISEGEEEEEEEEDDEALAPQQVPRRQKRSNPAASHHIEDHEDDSEDELHLAPSHSALKGMPKGRHVKQVRTKRR